MALLVLLTIPAGFLMVQPDLDRATQNALFVFHKNVGVLAAAPCDHPADLSGVEHASAAAVVGSAAPAADRGGKPCRALHASGRHAGGGIRPGEGGRLPDRVARRDGSTVDRPAFGRTCSISRKQFTTSAESRLPLWLPCMCGAALYHGILKRDGVFSRMWPPFGRSAAGAPLARAERNDI